MKEDLKMEDQILMLYYSVLPLVSGSVNHSIPTSKLKNFNKNCKGLGTTKKEKKQGRHTDGTIILFLYPLIFDTKVPRD